MWTAGGAGGSGFGGPDDFGAMAQRYWNALSDALRSAGGVSAPQDPWRAALDGWSRLAGGGARNDAGDAIERFSAQARQWLGTMQQVAGQFAGRDASAGDIAAAWKQALGGNPFADLFSATTAGMAGRGQSGFEQWYAEVAPMLGGLCQDGLGWLRMPAFGLTREHQERWQALSEAQLELQRRNDEYGALMLEANQDAFERFERKLAERSEPGRQLQSARALFDLWIDAAEEAYAEIALSPRFRRIYGELVNAQMRVRAGIQREIELIGNLFGMPGRTEVDAAHRRIAELERQVRRLTVAARAAGENARRPAPKAVITPMSAQAPEHAVPARSTAKSSATKPTAKKPPSPRATATKTSPAIGGKAAAAKAGSRTARAATGASARRVPRQAIAAIAMPDPLQPMPATSRPAKPVPTKPAPMTSAPKQAPATARATSRKR